MAKQAPMPTPGTGESPGDDLNELESRVTALLEISVPEYGDRDSLEKSLYEACVNHTKLQRKHIELRAIAMRAGNTLGQIEDAYGAARGRLFTTDEEVQKGKNAEIRDALVRERLLDQAEEIDVTKRTLKQLDGCLSIIDGAQKHLRFIKDALINKVALYKVDAGLQVPGGAG